RKIVCLEQGDFDGAERMRRKAELAALQIGSTQMFTMLLAAELAAHAQARDLTGVKDVMARIETLAAVHAGWVPYRDLAEARFELIRGDYEAAERKFRTCIESANEFAGMHSIVLAAWISASAGLGEALLALERPAETTAVISPVLARCDELGLV